MTQPNKAVPCYVCGTDQRLAWKTYAKQTWWIVCDGCGLAGPQRDGMAAAGEAWNAMQASTAVKIAKASVDMSAKEN